MGEQQRNQQVLVDLLQASDDEDLTEVERYYTDDYLDHHPSPGRATAAGIEGVRAAVRMFSAAFPDTRHEIHDIFAHGDRVVARVSATGTHSGEILGIPATGKRVFLEAIAIYRFEDGRIAERWAFQGKGILEQLRDTTRT